MALFTMGINTPVDLGIPTSQALDTELDEWVKKLSLIARVRPGDKLGRDEHTGIYYVDYAGTVQQLRRWWWLRDGRHRNPAEIPNGRGGEGHAPVLANDALILVCDQEDQSFVVALDRETGQELWSHHFDHSANATPMSYRLRRDGRQFVVVAAGGHAWSDAGDALVAFALPER